MDKYGKDSCVSDIGKNQFKDLCLFDQNVSTEIQNICVENHSQNTSPYEFFNFQP
jgi:hypothetical protein